MKICSNRDGSKWIEITKALLLFKPYERTRFIFLKAPGIKNKLYGLLNCRFKINKADNTKSIFNIKNLRIFIRLPFLYWEKHNCGWEFGLPGLYLWWHEARTKKYREV